MPDSENDDRRTTTDRQKGKDGEKSKPDGGREKTIKKQKDDSEKSAAGKSRQVPMPDSENDDRRTTTDRQKGKDGKKANRTAGKATKATTDEGKFRFCHSPLAALPQAAIFFALRV